MDNERLLEQIEQWKPFINKESQRYSNNICSVEDLKSEAILGIIDGLAKYDENKGSIKTYIYKCISNAIKDAAITSSFSLSVPSGSIKNIKEQSKYHALPLTDSITSQTIDTTLEDDVKDIISKYDKNNIAYLYFIENNTYSEISGITGISCSTISRFINKIKKIIKNRLTVA